MAQEPETNLLQTAATPPPAVGVSARELRSQVLHRLQVGLFGLAAMLLLVGLANIIMDRARLSDEGNDNGNSLSGSMTGGEPAVRPGSDPLVDIGVAPAADPSAAAMPETGSP
jgi:hypothetical protein